MLPISITLAFPLTTILVCTGFCTFLYVDSQAKQNLQQRTYINLENSPILVVVFEVFHVQMIQSPYHFIISCSCKVASNETDAKPRERTDIVRLAGGRNNTSNLAGISQYVNAATFARTGNENVFICVGKQNQLMELVPSAHSLLF